jgi:hypothetical protein
MFGHVPHLSGVHDIVNRDSREIVSPKQEVQYTIKRRGFTKTAGE